jgi:hypothetical protein
MSKDFSAFLANKSAAGKAILQRNESFKMMSCTFHKMGLILRSIEGVPKMHFSMARKIMLQLLRRCAIKLTEKTALT